MGKMNRREGYLLIHCYYSIDLRSDTTGLGSLETWGRGSFRGVRAIRSISDAAYQSYHFGTHLKERGEVESDSGLISNVLPKSRTLNCVSIRVVGQTSTSDSEALLKIPHCGIIQSLWLLP